MIDMFLIKAQKSYLFGQVNLIKDIFVAIQNCFKW